MIKITQISTQILIAGLFTYVGLQYASNKIAYVDNNKLVMEYKGAQQAQEVLKEKVDQWQANVDTLGQELEMKVKQYQEEKSTLKASQLQSREKELYELQQQYYQYREAIQQKMAEEDATVTAEVVTEINSFINNYAQDEGYLLIFGASGNGNMVYASPSLDITEDLLEQLNKSQQ